MENLEFDQLRAQMAVLEKKIASQEIVNDRLIRESMKDKMSWIKKYIIGEIILVPIAILLWLSISIYAHIPLWITLVMAIGCAIDIYFDWKVNVTPIKDSAFDRQNLIETAEKLRVMKRQRAIQTVVGVVAVFLFFAAVIVAFYLNNDDPSTWNSALVGVSVGLFIGIIVGAIAIAKIFKKMQQSNDKIIQQIEELTAEQ